MSVTSSQEKTVSCLAVPEAQFKRIKQLVKAKQTDAYISSPPDDIIRVADGAKVVNTHCNVQPAQSRSS